MRDCECLCCERGLDSERLQTHDDLGADIPVNAHASERDAAITAMIEHHGFHLGQKHTSMMVPPRSRAPRVSRNSAIATNITFVNS
ncbi:hypothetical protein [Nitrobacter hamburgensis]|uniref:hypothetical protein n=1 Tax=Nitrobacter hamburgensis TaxID=912 RepID=UPI001FDAC96B|nr:hypothetical protein [Nitrobacter hamburgensis]